MLILGYALMSNHVRLIAIPDRAESLSKTLQYAHSAYAAGWNRSASRSGHVWQGRFFSCPLDKAHFLTALRYVDLNPVRAGLVNTATAWAWSRAHVSPAFDDPLLDFDWSSCAGGWDYSEWRRLLAESAEMPDEWNALRRSTRTGEPLGSADFIRQIEKKEGRRLRVRERTGGLPGFQFGLF